MYVIIINLVWMALKAQLIVYGCKISSCVVKVDQSIQRLFLSITEILELQSSNEGLLTVPIR